MNEIIDRRLRPPLVFDRRNGFHRRDGDGMQRLKGPVSLCILDSRIGNILNQSRHFTP